MVTRFEPCKRVQIGGSCASQKQKLPPKKEPYVFASLSGDCCRKILGKLSIDNLRLVAVSMGKNSWVTRLLVETGIDVILCAGD